MNSGKKRYQHRVTYDLNQRTSQLFVQMLIRVNEAERVKSLGEPMDESNLVQMLIQANEAERVKYQGD